MVLIPKVALTTTLAYNNRVLQNNFNYYLLLKENAAHTHSNFC